MRLAKGFAAIGCFADNLKVFIAIQTGLQSPAHYRMVIDQQQPRLYVHLHVASITTAIQSSMRARGHWKSPGASKERPGERSYHFPVRIFNLALRSLGLTPWCVIAPATVRIDPHRRTQR
jgi:hypothetical protein